MTRFFSCFQRCFDDSLIRLLLWDLCCKISFLSGHKAIKIDKGWPSVSSNSKQHNLYCPDRHQALPDSNGRLRLWLQGSWSGSGSWAIYTLLRLPGHGGDNPQPGRPHRHPPWLRWEIGDNTNHCNHPAVFLIRTLHLIEDSAAITTCSRYSWRVLTRGAPLRNNCAKPRTELDKTSRLESWNIYITTIRKCDAHNVHFEHFEWWSWFYSIEEFMRIAIYCNNKFSRQHNLFPKS